MVTRSLWGLLHDASEAYLIDLPRPLKRYGSMGAEYQKIEANLQRMICQKYGLDPVQPQGVEYADKILLMTEKRDLMSMEPKPWEDEHYQPLPDIIHPWNQATARLAFMNAFHEFTVHQRHRWSR